MNMKITRREFIVTRIEKIEHVYTVRAETEEEAIAEVLNYNVDSGDIRCLSEEQPVVEQIQEYTECPNKGEGWSSIPLEVVEEMIADRPEMFDGLIPLTKGGRSWHYNGLCRGEKLDEVDFCYRCRSAQKEGWRLLSNEEKKYLNRAYGKELNVQE